MQRFYFKFPGGLVGVGLFILRTTAASGAALFGGILVSRLGSSDAGQFSYFIHLIWGLLLISGSVFLVLGLMMPLASITLAVCQLIGAYIRLTAEDPIQGKRFGWIALLLHAGISVAVFFLGPGAYSIDARLYGLRRVFIPLPKKEDREGS